jgi:D-aspartate ligase
MTPAVPLSAPRPAAQGTPPTKSVTTVLPAATVPVVVVGLDCVTGLQTARIFARRGIPVIGLAANPGHPCCRTRCVTRVVGAEAAGAGLIDALAELGGELGSRAVLVPCTDLSVLEISRHRQALGAWYHLALPDEEVVEMLVDKARFAAFARERGLPIPTTFVLRTGADVEAAAGAIRFPAILKPTVKTPAWSGEAGAKAFRVNGPDELARLFERCSPWADSLIVQEWIPGGDGEQFTCNCYFDEAGEPLVTFTTRKVRQWPPFGGEACLSEESRNEAVERETVRLYRAVRHHGLGYLEMKRDPRTGAHLIVEPNVGRPTGRSASAEAAGVELLMTMYCELLGRPLPAAREQRYLGTKWIHLRRDLQSALFRWWRGELTVREWVRSLRGPLVEPLFSWRDPVPFWADLARVFGDALLHRLPGRRPARAP